MTCPALPGLLVRRLTPAVRDCARYIQATHIVDAGPCFLPELDLPAYRLHGRPSPAIDHLHSIPATNILGVSMFGLSLSASPEREQLLDILIQNSHFLLLADFKMAERNLEEPACLLFSALRRLCGLHADSTFRRRGMEGILYEQRNRLIPVLRKPFWAGGVTMALYEVPRQTDGQTTEAK